MFTVFQYQLRRFRGQIIGWGIGLGLLGIMLLAFYPSFAGQQEQLEEFLSFYPEEMTAFFGDFSDFGTPQGFLDIEFFSYMPLVLGIFGVLAGTGLLVADEEAGRLDLIMGYPISRSKMLGGRFLAFVSASILISLISWFGLILPTFWQDIDINVWSLMLPFLDLLIQVLLFGAIGLFFSLLLPSRRMAAMLSGVLLVASFFVTGLSELITELEPAAELSPMSYYLGGEAMEGLHWGWTLGLVGAILMFLLLSWWLFQRREISVGGEGGWKLPSLRPASGAGD